MPATTGPRGQPNTPAINPYDGATRKTGLARIAAPVLMIWGEDDPYGGPDIGRRAAQILPNASLEVIPGRHAPFLDDPARCGAAIGDLLRAA